MHNIDREKLKIAVAAALNSIINENSYDEVIRNNKNNETPKKSAYSVPEAAKVIGISRSLMYTLIGRNEIPYCRIGEKRILIPAKALDEWLEKQTVGGGE